MMHTRPQIDQPSSQQKTKKEKQTTIIGRLSIYSLTHLLPQKLDDHVAAQTETAEVYPVPGTGEPAVDFLGLRRELESMSVGGWVGHKQ